MDANIIPIVAIVGGMATAVIITCAALFVDHRKQVMRNQERLAAIEKGVPLPVEPAGGSNGCGRRGSLYRGIKLLFIGAGLALALWVSVGDKMAIWGAFIAIIGLGHLFYWFLAERDQTAGPAA